MSRIDPALWKLALCGILLSTLMATIAAWPITIGLIAAGGLVAVPGFAAGMAVAAIRRRRRRFTR